MDLSTLAVASSSSTSSFPYTQPTLPTLLTALSFLFFLNVLRIASDIALDAGLVAELFLGMVYGAPLAGILKTQWETTFNVLGYLGLIFIIFQGRSIEWGITSPLSTLTSAGLAGGLATNLSLLLRNLPLSCICAFTGIGMPIALSFALLTAGYGYSSLEAFAAGAALSSTSLGTTLAALNSVSRQVSSPGAGLDAKKHSHEGMPCSLVLRSNVWCANLPSTGDRNGH